MKTWHIAGSSSRVGKTHLAMKLMEIFPRAVYVKLGYGKKKKGGPENFFKSEREALGFIAKLKAKGESEHCLIESNRLVGKSDADLVIFLDSVEGDRRADADRVRALADIVLGYRGNKARWKSGIEKLRLSSAQEVKLLGVLREQHEYLRRSRISLRTKMWLSRNRRIVFGEGLARLLHGIQSQGSLSRAAKDEGMSYRHAWGDMKKAEERLGFKLLERSIGGKSGGGSSLTDKGCRLLEAYEEMKLKTIRESDRLFQRMFRDILEDT